MRSLFLLGALLTHGLSGCGDGTQATTTDAGGGGQEPTTARALAYVAAEHAGTPDSAVRESDAAEEFTSGGIGTELRYGSDGEYDGDMLVVAAGAGLDTSLIDCDARATDSLAGCVKTSQGTLMWENEAPEEDPGVVYVLVDKGDSAALVFYAGPSITGDPRKLEMPISTEVLFAIAGDPRVDVTTSAEAVAAGADLSFWQDQIAEPQCRVGPVRPKGLSLAVPPARHAHRHDRADRGMVGAPRRQRQVRAFEWRHTGNVPHVPMRAGGL